MPDRFPDIDDSTRTALIATLSGMHTGQTIPADATEFHTLVRTNLAVDVTASLTEEQVDEAMAALATEIEDQSPGDHATFVWHVTREQLGYDDGSGCYYDDVNWYDADGNIVSEEADHAAGANDAEQVGHSGHSGHGELAYDPESGYWYDEHGWYDEQGNPVAHDVEPEAADEIAADATSGVAAELFDDEAEAEEFRQSVAEVEEAAMADLRNNAEQYAAELEMTSEEFLAVVESISPEDRSKLLAEAILS